MNDLQLLKAYGWKPNLSMKSLANASMDVESQKIADEVLIGRSCGHPDAADREIAESSPDRLERYLGCDHDVAEDLVSTHAAMLAATGQGSFPNGCHRDVYNHEDRHCVLYYVSREQFNQNYLRACTTDELEGISEAGVWPWTLEEIKDRWTGEPLLDVALWLTEEAYRRVGVKLMITDDHDKANIHLTCKPIGGSTIGLGWFNDGSCSSHVEARIDSGWRANLSRVTLLIAHEMGHNHNLQHQFTNQSRHHGVMSYNWGDNFYGFLDGNENIYPRDPSWVPLSSYFGGEPIPGGEQPPPTPGEYRLDGTVFANTFPGGIAIRGELRITGNEDLGVYIAYPIGQGVYEFRTKPLI